MKKKLIIFGIGKIAEVVHYYAVNECGFEVEAFCVDSSYKNTDFFLEKNVVAFEDIENQFPPSDYDLFIAVGYHELNALRTEKCQQALKKGYNLPSIVSPKTEIPKNVTFGYNCFIMPPSIIHPCVSIGNNVFVWSGAMVGHHSIIKDNCWLTSSCNIGGNVTIGDNSFLAVNATIGHSVLIGKECFIGANTLITKDITDKSVLIQESSKPIRLNSEQFLRMSKFSSL